MKRIIQIVSLSLAYNLSAQFPAPTNFQYSYNYLSFEQWGVCNGEAVAGPGYCSYFVWNMPDTSSTDAYLDHFEVYNNYNDNVSSILSISDTMYSGSGAYIGDLYVVAVYYNPIGTSEPSNIVNNPDLPIGFKDVRTIPHVSFIYYSETGFLKVFANEDINNFQILNSLGQTIFSGNNFNSSVYIGNYRPGIYFVKLLCNENHLYSDKFLKN